MKPFLTAVVAIVLGTAGTSLAQTMVEYSSLAGKAAGPTKALSTKLNASNDKIASSLASADTSSQPVATKSSAQAKTATPPADQPPVIKPAPPAIFILTNGERIESDHYVLKTDSVQLQDKGVERSIPIKQLNVNATMSENNERGLHLMFPTSTSQITLSF